MTEYTAKCPATLAANPVGPIGSFTQTARQWLAEQRFKARIQRERATLLTLSDAQLRDIGLDRAAAEQEARRSDIPAGRRIV